MTVPPGWFVFRVGDAIAEHQCAKCLAERIRCAVASQQVNTLALDFTDVVDKTLAAELVTVVMEWIAAGRLPGPLHIQGSGDDVGAEMLRHLVAAAATAR